MRGDGARFRARRFDILRGVRFFIQRYNNLQGRCAGDKDARVAVMGWFPVTGYLNLLSAATVKELAFVNLSREKYSVRWVVLPVE